MDSHGSLSRRLDQERAEHSLGFNVHVLSDARLGVAIDIGGDP
jgi:hypothetical protein